MCVYEDVYVGRGYSACLTVVSGVSMIAVWGEGLAGGVRCGMWYM